MANRSTEATQGAPRRTCVGCRKVAATTDLLRFVATEVGVRQGRTLPGRGAWLCRDRACLDLALRRGTFGRALGVGRVDADAVRAEFDGADPRADV